MRLANVASLIFSCPLAWDGVWERALEVDRARITELRAANRATAIAGYLAGRLYGR